MKSSSCSKNSSEPTPCRLGSRASSEAVKRFGIEALHLANHRHPASSRRRTSTGLIDLFELAGRLKWRNRLIQGKVTPWSQAWPCGYFSQTEHVAPLRRFHNDSRICSRLPRNRSADADHVDTQLGRPRLNSRRHRRRIVHRLPLRIHWTIAERCQLHPTSALGLNRRLDHRVVARLRRSSSINHLGQHRIGHDLLASRCYVTHGFITAPLSLVNDCAVRTRSPFNGSRFNARTPAPRFGVEPLND